jgi:Ca2+-binding RTX toxin-like protein
MRTAPVGFVAAAVLAAVAPAASADVGPTGHGPRIDITATLPAEEDEVVVSATGSGPTAAYLITAASGISQVAGTCAQLDPTTASCPAAGITNIGVFPGNGDDIVRTALANATGSGFALRTITVIGERGSDVLDMAGVPATLRRTEVHGSAGRDRLLGGPERDVLLGERNFDLIKGRGGRDSLRGGIGIDVLRGGPDDDALFGEQGGDFLGGGGGFDQLNGGIGFDRALGKVTARERRRATSVERFP